MKMKITISGPQGCGKSTVSAAFARRFEALGVKVSGDIGGNPSGSLAGVSKGLEIEFVTTNEEAIEKGGTRLSAREVKLLNNLFQSGAISDSIYDDMPGLAELANGLRE